MSGPVASGDNVIESKSSAPFSDPMRAEPEFIAVEMEAAKAAAAESASGLGSTFRRFFEISDASTFGN